MAIRVLHLVHWLTRGGIENWLLDFCRAADRAQLEMDVCCRGPSTGILAPRFAELGTDIHLAPLGWNQSHFGKELGRILREGKYDLLHIHAGSFAGYPATVGRRNNVAVVTTFHSTEFGFENSTMALWLGWLRAIYTRRSFRTACRAGNALVSCSQATQEVIARLSGIEPDGRFHIVPYGSSKSPGRNPQVRSAKRAELGLSETVPVGLHVGTLKDPKNHAGLLRIADRIRQGIPDFRMLLAGDGPLRPRIENQIRELKLENVVMLLGSRGDVEQLLEASDVLIFPSLWEGLPVAVIEAQMKGLPVIGSDISPMKEATLESRTSMLFPVEQELQMARAVIELLRDEPRRRSMGNAGIEFAKENFSMNSNVSRYLQIYQDAISRANAGSGHVQTGTACD